MVTLLKARSENDVYFCVQLKSDNDELANLCCRLFRSQILFFFSLLFFIIILSFFIAADNTHKAVHFFPSCLNPAFRSQSCSFRLHSVSGVLWAQISPPPAQLSRTKRLQLELKPQLQLQLQLQLAELSKVERASKRCVQQACSRCCTCSVYVRKLRELEWKRTLVWSLFARCALRISHFQLLAERASEVSLS